MGAIRWRFLCICCSMSLVFYFPAEAQWWGKSASVSESTSSKIRNKFPSSVVLPMHGNVYPLGYYYVELNVGLPARPYFLDPDTGSDLTWLQCDAPSAKCTKQVHPLYELKNSLVQCMDPMCTSLHWPDVHICEKAEQCDYEVDYADGGSSLGVLVWDMVPLNLNSQLTVSARLALGCGYDQIPSSSSHHALDGILGLGKGKISVVSQLHGQGIVRNVLGHCLRGGSVGGGFLFFGDDLYDHRRVTWAKMSRSSKHYSPGCGELTIGRKGTRMRNLTLFDSGSSYTYFTSEIYHVVVDSVITEIGRMYIREAREDTTLPLCWRGKRAFKHVREVKNYFKDISLSFEVGLRSKSVFQIPPDSYLIISSKGNVCLGVLNGTEAGLDNVNLIGDISMQDKLVVYDNDKERIGWADVECERVWKKNK